MLFASGVGAFVKKTLAEGRTLLGLDGATTDILVGGGVVTAPVWTTATGTGPPVRQTNATLITPALGTPTSGTLTNCTGLPQAGITGLTTADSPVFVTVKLSGLGTLNIPKHVDDATGLADTTINVTANNEVTNPSQPAFVATLGSSLLNVTGDDTVYTIVFDTEVKDQGADFNGTTTFTAPVTGLYSFAASVMILGMSAAHGYCVVSIVTSNRTFRNYIGSAAMNIFDPWTLLLSVTADMDAGDTAMVTVAVGTGTKVVDISGNATTPGTHFSGYLVC